MFDQATPRPVTTSASERLDAGTRGCQFAASVTASSTASSWSFVWPRVMSLPWLMFCIRKATGSIFAACARSSITCSAANPVCGALPARIQCTLIQLFRIGSDLTRYRLVGLLYIRTGQDWPLMLVGGDGCGTPASSHV